MNEVMADIFIKIIQKRRGGKSVITEEEKSPKKETKKRVKSKLPTLVSEFNRGVKRG